MPEEVPTSAPPRRDRRISGSVLLAGVLAAGAAAWIASGQFGDIGAETGSPEAASPETPLVSVRVRPAVATFRQRRISITGRTEASRQVTLRAQTPGPVARVLASEGDVVRAGETIVRQDVEDRRARLAEAEALIHQRRLEFSAARELGKKGFRSETRVAEAGARLESAKAMAEVMRIDIGRTAIRAPFAGVLEDRPVEVGAYLKAGDPIASLVDLDPVYAVGFVAERQIPNVRVGMAGKLRLIGGAVADGEIRFVSSVANPSTRTFRVEMETPNPAGRIKAGQTVEMVLTLPEIRSFLISPSILTLNEDGAIGVRTVNAENVVEFVPVTVIGDAPEGIWVVGLTEGMRLITVGHEFVKAGFRVRAIAETAETAS